MSTILITGANGEIGHELIQQFSKRSGDTIVAFDINDLDESLSSLVHRRITGDILNTHLLESLFKEYEFDSIFHLASMLSTSAEKDPVKAHHVNTDGAINLLALSERFSRKLSKQVVFIFPSSIAVYGLPDIQTSEKVGKIKEEEWNKPATMYGCNKLYIELLGNYYERYFKKESAEVGFFDFRSLRFPGLLSATTLPTGGTSDFGPEILHFAAQGLEYQCFVREDTAIPFMAMPDAVKALTMLASTEKKTLKHNNYNVGSFSITAAQITQIAQSHFPDTKITYVPHQKRQAIVDSWPIDIDDSLARSDWGWKPDYDKDSAFEKYLIPSIKARYKPNE